MLDKNVKVKEIRDLGSRNYFLILSSPQQAQLARPGQFVMLKCSENIEESPLLRRPFSIFNIHRHARTGKPLGLELLIKDVGPGTHKLAHLRAGHTIFCLGPQGRGFQVSNEMSNRIGLACLVAGGVGIAALFLLAQSLMAQKIKPVLFYGGHSASDLVLREYFEQVGIEAYYATEDGSYGEHGLVTYPLAKFLKALSRKDIRIYTCGPWKMMQAVHQLSQQHQLPCEVSLEARMGCSLGACMGCVIRGWSHDGEEQYFCVCQDGPIMSSRQVDWETNPL